MEIDTGAAESLMPHSLFKTLHTCYNLVPSDCQFRSFTEHPVDVIGCSTILTKPLLSSMCKSPSYQVYLHGEKRADAGVEVHNRYATWYLLI